MVNRTERFNIEKLKTTLFCNQHLKNTYKTIKIYNNFEI